MGKGDIKTKRGKISNHSFGKKRPHKTTPKQQKPAEEEAVAK